MRSTLQGLYRTAVLRHDAVGQETLLNLLLRNYLHYLQYDQARPRHGGPHGSWLRQDSCRAGEGSAGQGFKVLFSTLSASASS